MLIPTNSINSPVTDARRRRLAQDPLEKARVQQIKQKNALNTLSQAIISYLSIQVWRQQPRDKGRLRETMVLLQKQLRVLALPAFSVTTGKRTKRRIQKAQRKAAKDTAPNVKLL